MQMIDSSVLIFGLTYFIPATAKQLLLAAIIGLVMGFERAWRRKAASLRTFAFISTGSCLFTLLSIQAFNVHPSPSYDVTRVAAQIVAGVGFIGGGVIFKTSDRIEGITTGAMIWINAAIGMACGFNHIDLAIWGFAVYVFVHFLAKVMHDLINIARPDPTNPSIRKAQR